MHRNDARVSRQLAILVASVGALSASCKETDRLFYEEEEHNVVLARRDAKVEVYADDAEYLQKNSTFYFRVWDESFTARLDDLPNSGEVPDSKKPYSGSYYAEQDGGTDQPVAGGRSPLAKYDEAFYGGQNKAQD